MSLRARLHAIIPSKATLDLDEMDAALRRGLDRIGDVIDSDFHKTTATWKESVNFVRTGPVGEGSTMWLSISTSDKVYVILELGAKPHIIRPRRAPMLVFRWDGKGSYRAKTQPGWLGSMAGGATGNITRRPYVHHPGSKPRRWAKTIVRVRSRQARDYIQMQVEEAARR